MKKARDFQCPCCNAPARFPLGWSLGVESVFSCPSCGCKLRTGYKTGAAIFGFSLALAVATANLGVWLFSSRSILFFVAGVLPLWVIYGFWLRRRYLLWKYRRGIRRQKGEKSA